MPVSTFRNSSSSICEGVYEAEIITIKLAKNRFITHGVVNRWGFAGW
jgi:hypothetical protein